MPRYSFRPIGGSAVAVAADSGDSSCFADEVVVDFPSVAGEVERIRAAFARPDGTAPLAAAIRLSSREAREGARLPLAVPVRCTCRDCGGRGEAWTEPCGRCSGGGIEVRRHQVIVAVPAGVHDGARFYFSVAPKHDLATRIELHVVID